MANIVVKIEWDGRGSEEIDDMMHDIGLAIAEIRKHTTQSLRWGHYDDSKVYLILVAASQVDRLFIVEYTQCLEDFSKDFFFNLKGMIAAAKNVAPNTRWELFKKISEADDTESILKIIEFIDNKETM